MNVYIVIDMECISGISAGNMIRVGHAEWAARGRRIMTREINVAIEGALAAGAKRIWVKDGHDAGENLLSEELNPAAELLSGTTSAIPDHLPGIDSGFNAMFLMGFHARMGTLHGHFDHTISTATISEVRLNGTPVGELGIYAAIAGVHGVPVRLVTGDRAATDEMRALVGDVEAVAVKDGFGRNSARVRSPQVTHPEIRAAAERALRDGGGRPWKLDLPIRIEVDFLRSADADMAEMIPEGKRMGARSVGFTHDHPRTAFRALNAMVALGGVAANRWARNLYGSGSPVS
ncbi:MAG: hypothetical protein FJX78_02450 [Armatimonadetes bacterium]|nr:hypothetical protein [Armatimonadota bacterium]